MKFRVPEIFLGVFLTIAIFALGAVSWSSRHSPSNEQYAESNQHSGPKGDEKNRETQSLWVPTDSVGLYTLVLCVFTGVLALVSIFQGVMLLRSDKTSRIAADAARLNAQAVIDAERSHLYVIVIQHDVIETIQAGHQGKRDPRLEKTKMHPPVLAYIFRNAGKTPAILEEVMHSMMLEKTEKHTITYETPDRALEIIAGESDLTDRIAVSFDERTFLVEDAMALGDHGLMLFFYSAATYRDIYNRKHKIRHDFLYSAGRFHLINRIEKTIEPQEQGGAESEQTSRTGFFSRPS